MTDTTKQASPEKVRISFTEKGEYAGIVWKFAEVPCKPEGGAIVTYVRADQVRELQLKAIRETIKETLYQLGRAAKYGGCIDAEVMSWVDPETILENLK